MKWSFGKDLPYSIRYGASVQLENTFLIVGGYNGSYLNTLWKYDQLNEDWIQLNQTLKTARQWTTAFLVPDEFCLEQ